MTDQPQAGEGSHFWERLRRRKVVQWGIAYSAGAWGFLQGLQYVSDAFAWPAQLRQIAILALVLGLPIALTLAWYHGDKGQQRVSRAELAILTLLFLLGGGLFWRYEHQTPSAQTLTQTSPAPTAAAPTATPPAANEDSRPSVAALPFENRSDDKQDAFFVDGIHDDILTQLSKISGLKVISRTSVERFRDTKLPLQDVAMQLGVKSILEGGVQRAGNRVRINVQLIDAATDGHLWAESYDRELTAANIFAIQSEVAGAIAGALRATLTPAEKTRVNAVPTQDLAAWEAYQLGKQRMAQRTSVSMAEAVQFFQKSIDHDPKFALAYVGLADASMLQIWYGGARNEVQLAKADAAAKTALQLDPDLGEAWVSSADLADWRGNPEQAETMYRHALALNSNYASAHQWFGELLRDSLGRSDEALIHQKLAVELDPLSAMANASLGLTLVTLDRTDEAAAAFRKAIEIDPSMPRAYGFLSDLMAYGSNHFAEAVELATKTIELDQGSPIYQVELAMLYIDLGDVARAARIAGVARKRWPANPWVNLISSALYMMQGDGEAALRSVRTCLASAPRDPTALGRLGALYWERGEYEAARALIDAAYPEFSATPLPMVNASNLEAAISLVPLLQKIGAGERAGALLDQAERKIRGVQRLGYRGYGLADVQIHALRGDKAKALAALRAAEQAGWRGPLWRYYRDFDPNLASIRNEPEFKAVFADIERDMARQRAELAKRPKDAPLPLLPVAASH